MARMIAGHMMEDSPRGYACHTCGRLWLDMLYEREYWKPGLHGVAHSGALTQTEVNELNAELDRIWNAIGRS